MIYDEKFVQAALEKRCIDTKHPDVGFCPGWTDTLWFLHQGLKALHPEYKITQVKEKFGSLRFYTYGSLSDEARTMISKAEASTQNICCNCGIGDSNPDNKIIIQGFYAWCEECWEENE